MHYYLGYSTPSVFAFCIIHPTVHPQLTVQTSHFGTEQKNG